MVRGRSNRGSVLLLVVGLLTIIAMLGGTFLVISHLDAQQSEAMAAKAGADPLASGVASQLAQMLRMRLNIDATGPYHGATNSASWPVYVDCCSDDEKISACLSDISATPTHPSNFEGTNPTWNRQDTDGDTQIDAWLNTSYVMNSQGDVYLVAVRVIDTSGLLCVNTAGTPLDPVVNSPPVNVDLKTFMNSLKPGSYDSLNTGAKGRGGTSMASYHLNTATRLVSPAAGLPFCVGDEMFLRWLGTNAPTNTGRLYDVLAWDDAVPDGTMRRYLTTFACSRSLMRRPAAGWQKRLAILAGMMDSQAVRDHLYTELASAAAGGGGGGGGAPGTPVYMDNGGAGFSSAGAGWASTSAASYYKGSALYISANYPGPGTGGSTATWTFSGLAAGQYDVAVTWGTAGYYKWASNAPYTVYDGGTSLTTVNLNQTVAPSGTAADGVPWADLGTFNVNSGTLKVVLSNACTGQPIADGVKICPITAATVGNSDAAAHFVANLWAAMSPDYATAAAKAFAYKPPGGTTTMYGVVDQPVIAEAFAMNAPDTPAGANNSKWGAAVEILNPCTHPIDLAAGGYQVQVKSGTKVPLTGTLASGGRMVMYEVGGGTANPNPALTDFGFQSDGTTSGTTIWKHVSGLTFIGSGSVKLLRVAEAQSIPIDSVVSADLGYTCGNPGTDAAQGKDVSRDDNVDVGAAVGRSRALIAYWAAPKDTGGAPTHTLGAANSGVDLTSIPATLCLQGFEMRVPYGLLKVPGDLTKLYATGPQDTGEDLPHQLVASKLDPGRGHADVKGQVKASGVYPSIPWAALLGEMFETTAMTDTTRSDDPLQSRVYGRINVNTAPLTVLQRLPWPTALYANNVSVVTLPGSVATDAAQRIIDYREKTGPYTAGRATASGLTGLRADFDFKGYLSPGEVAIPLADYIDSLGGFDHGRPEYFEARNYLYKSICNAITASSDTYVAYIRVQLGSDPNTPKYTWFYIALIDRSNCFGVNDTPAVLLFSEVR